MEIDQLGDIFNNINDYDGLLRFVNENKFRKKSPENADIPKPNLMKVDVYELSIPNGAVAVHYIEKMDKDASGKRMVYERKALLSLNYVSMGSILLK